VYDQNQPAFILLNAEIIDLRGASRA